MDKSMLLGVLMGVTGATAGGALASYAVWNKVEQPVAAIPAQPAMDAARVLPQQPEAEQFARVVAVEPVVETSRYPKQQCHSHQVVHRRAVKDSNQVTGTLLGGVIGGALGNQVGKGRGRDVATVAGAIAGGYAGNRVQKNMQEGDTYTTTEQRCTTRTQTRRKTVAYDVTYRWNGALTSVRMKKHPGDRLPVENGEVLLASSQRTQTYD